MKGHSRSIICDLNRNRYDAIPNALYTILTEFPNRTVNEIKAEFENMHDEYIDEYFDFLLEKDYIFFIDRADVGSFPKLDLKYEHPSHISNCIVDIDYSSDHNYTKIAAELQDLLTYHVELRFFSSFSIAQIKSILTNFEAAHFNIELAVCFDGLTFSDIEDLSTVNCVTAVRIYRVPENLLQSFSESCKFNIYFSKQPTLKETSCGLVDPSRFIVNVKMFSESQTHNSCLNRKISIDKAGYIKNCPSMKADFGHINSTSLINVAEDLFFRKFWGISKNEISVCKDCEFRYICVDCRAYVDSPEDQLSKPLKCGYNPYTISWEDWSKNPLKQNIAGLYGMTDFQIHIPA